VVDVHEANALPMARIDYGGIVKEACLAYVPQAQPGDYVIVHVGFAISLLDEEEALATLAALREVNDLEAELGLAERPAPP